MLSYGKFLRRLGLKRAILHGDYARLREVRLLAEAIEGAHVERALDVGCAGTVFPHYLAALFPRARVLGIDSEQNLTLDAHRLTEDGTRLGVADRLHLFIADARRLPSAAGTFDLVTSVSTVEHIEGDGDIEAVAEMARAVRPGGLVVLTVPTHHTFLEQSRSPAVDYFERRYDGDALRQRLAAHPDLEVQSTVCFEERIWKCGGPILRMRRLNARWAHRPLLRPLRWMLWVALMLTPLMSRLFLRQFPLRDDANVKQPGGAVVTLRRRWGGPQNARA